MIYRFGDFEIDIARFELRRRGEPVHVEPQVFSVLMYLVEHRDRVVSKMELLDEVWEERIVSESALTSRIQAARRACGDSGRAQTVIQTRHGRGYRFVAPVELVEITSSRPAHHGVAPNVAVLGSGQVMGRERELAVLDAALAGANADRRNVVFVSAPAGYGKTALVETALERADLSESVVVLRAQARPHAGLPEPYVSLLEALGEVCRREKTDIIEIIDRTAPMWLMQLPSLVSGSDIDALARRTVGGTRARMLREGVDLFKQISAERGLVFIAEDIHWADDSSLEIIAWLAASTAAAGPVLVATFRPGEPDGRVERALEGLAGSSTLGRLELGPLDDAAIAAMVLSRLDAVDVEDGLSEILTAHSGGSPLFATEALDFWNRDGSIELRDGQVRMRSSPDELRESVPSSVRNLIDASLDRLNPEELALLEVASVAGRDFPAFAVAAALNEPTESVERRLGALARRDRLVSAVGDEAWPDGTVSTVFRLSHDLHQQILYDRIPASRRATVHQAIGERLETAFGRRVDEHVIVLARHFLAAADNDRAADYLHRAGEQALAKNAHHDAVESLEAALRILENLPESQDRDRREVAIRVSLGPALIATVGWKPAEVETNYRRALRLCESQRPTPARAIARYGLASVHELRGEYGHSEALLREQLADGSGLGVETQELLACSLFHQGSFSDSLVHAQAGLDIWDDADHSIHLARYGEHPGVSFKTWGALSAWFLGDVEGADRMAREALQMGASNEYALAWALVQCAFLDQHRLDVERCRSWAASAVRIAGEQGFPFRAAQGAVLLAWCDARLERRSADVELAGAFDRYAAFGARMDEPYYLGLLADTEIAAGRPTSALNHLDEADRVMRATTRAFYCQPELVRLRAVAIAEIGDLDASLPLIEEARSIARDRDVVPIVLRIALTALDLQVDVQRHRTVLAETVARYPSRVSFTELDRARALLSDDARLAD